VAPREATKKKKRSLAKSTSSEKSKSLEEASLVCQDIDEEKRTITASS
jgi:hypothetical protein